jgi:serine phosphatase RsbU (regulator of sigma subunit)
MRLAYLRYLIFSLFSVSTIVCQQRKIDSLTKILTTQKEDTNKVYTLNRLGNALANMGNFDDALTNFEASLELSKKLNYHFGIASSLNSCGKIYLNRSDYPEALEHFIQSLEEAEKYNIKPGMAAALGNMGIIYDNQGEYDKALRYHFKSLKIDEELGNLKGVAHSYNSIGNIWFSKKNYAKVIEYYNKSLDIKYKIGDIEGTASTLANIGNTYYYQNNFPKTREYYFKAQEKFEEAGDIQSQTMLLNNIAETYIGEKKFKEALPYTEKSLKLSLQIGALDETKSAYLTRSHIQEGLGHHDLAFKDYKLYDRFKDSIYNEENTRKTIESEVKYHFSKKEMNTRIENERKQITLKEEAKKQRLIIYFGSGILVLVIGFAIYAYRSFKQKQKINLQLSQQKEEIEAQRDEIELQRSIVEEKNKNVTDSINYAKRIQYTLLANESLLDKHLPEHFIYFCPKDIVSGDFYWAANIKGSAITGNKNRFYLAVCDSTGHGVPGAFMSLLNIGFLSEAVNERGLIRPSDILNHVRERLIDSISKEGQRDGFDGILICIDEGKNVITYASAQSNPVLIKNDTVVELPYDKMPVGYNIHTDSFTLNSFEYAKGDMLYLFTDGYADQFGGEKGKKFKHRKLLELFQKMNNEPVERQHEILENRFNSWKGELEQLDDVCVIGIKL